MEKKPLPEARELSGIELAMIAINLEKQKEAICEAADLHLQTILELQRIQALVSNVDDPVHRPIGVALVELEEKFQKIHDEWSK